MIKKQKRTNLVMFTNSKGNVTVEVRLIDDTVWLTQQQIAELFEKDRSVITRHINNVFKSSELGKEVCAKFAHTANDGKTYQSNFYNLDMIISVGYRINSKRGIEFRRWANNLIKNHLIKGYTVNKSRIKKTQLEELNRTIELISDTLVNQNLLDDKSSELLYMIKSYSKTWSILIEYDENKLEIPNYKDNRDINRINYEEAKKAINLLKVKLVSEKQAGELFGLEKNKSLHGILNNIYQTFDKKDLYSSLEEKAAHLLYFIIKDHPFNDGNKRIACLLLVMFLNRNKNLTKEINPTALTALALLIAESNPSDKEIIIKLIVNLLITRN